MHDATTTQPRAADNTLRTGPEGLCVGNGKSLGGNLPARTGGTAQIAYVSDVVSVLKRKRDRYKGLNKMIQARTVQACIDELRGVWK